MVLQCQQHEDFLRHTYMATERFKISGRELIVLIFCIFIEFTMQRPQKVDKYSDTPFIKGNYLCFQKSLSNLGKSWNSDHEIMIKIS